MELNITFTQTEVTTLLMALDSAHNEAVSQLQNSVGEENQKLFQGVIDSITALVVKINNTTWKN